MSAYPGIRIEGGLLGPDVLDKLLSGELPGQRPAEFGLGARRSLTDEIAAAFADARSLWGVFQNRLARLAETDLGTSVTRDAWVIPFLGLLGYELSYNARAYEVDGLTYAISHRAGDQEDAPPVHIVGARQGLGRLAPSGRPRMAPHSLVQQYLNRSEQLWGIVTNGETLRLLRDSTFVRKQAYVEFDLRAILEEQLFPDFVVLYRLIHRSRLPRGIGDAAECLLEKYYAYSVEQGGRVREHLRDGVEECLKRLANGFLSYPGNAELRARVLAGEGEPSRITPDDLYRQLLRLVYRFLFLLVSEERGLISSDPIYRSHYGVTRLRRLVDDRAAYTDHDDIWRSLLVLWKVLSDGRLAAFLHAAPLDGELFAPLALDAYSISNRDFLGAFWYLAWYQESRSSSPRRVNYAALDVEELGSVYESLLEYRPQIDTSAQPPRFDLGFGSERRSTGSYYTPPELVGELIRAALEPVIEERLEGARTQEEKERAILSIRVCDPAAGSGHFLLAAARRLGRELARIRSGEEEPPPEHLRSAIRDVVAHCIYGVDKNPLAVELCRVALWLESHAEGKPLTFLDHRIRCGDSLVGVFDLKVLEQGIPDGAFQPVSGDDKALTASLKRQNAREQAGQRTLFGRFDPTTDVEQLSARIQALGAIPDDSPEAVRKKAEAYNAVRYEAERDRSACDLWTAAFFQPKSAQSPQAALITSESLRRHLEASSPHPQAMAEARALSERLRFFHWPLEFPEAFAEGGFDVVLGNPPWERIKLQEQEFFAARDPEIARAPNAASRKRLIQRLADANPGLWREYQQALYDAESASRFLRGSAQYPLTARGDINTYSVFAERMRGLLRPDGRAGIIVPTGIATDDTNKHFFADLVDRGGLRSLFDFENRERLFPAVDSRYKFCLLTMASVADKTASARGRFAFFCTRADHLRDPRRVFALSPEDIARINPNTRTCPVFRTRQDAELTRAIYERVPVLVNEAAGENPWGVRFLRMLDMSNDSALFRTAGELEEQGFRPVGNRYLKGGEVYLPLYEAKMIWHYDHRFGTYEGVADRSSTHLPTPDEAQHADPGFLAQPWYWVPAAEVEARLGDWRRGWLLGFRDVTNATNERTAIFSLLPRVGAGHTMPLAFADCSTPTQGCALLADFKSLALDWTLRQKAGGTHLTFFILRQLPMLPESMYSATNQCFVVLRVLELAYTSWDSKPFADDIWADSPLDLREAIRQQWEDNAAATGGHAWELPDWIEAYPEIETDRQKGIPHPPFKWDEGRRARLRAELDALFARLYGLSRKQLRYILDPADLTPRELEDILDPWEEVHDPLDAAGYAARAQASDFPGETFRVLKEKEIRQYGEYRTRRLVLEAWEALPAVSEQAIVPPASRSVAR